MVTETSGFKPDDTSNAFSVTIGDNFNADHDVQSASTLDTFSNDPPFI
jgi:hypothetical protein